MKNGPHTRSVAWTRHANVKTLSYVHQKRACIRACAHARLGCCLVYITCVQMRYLAMRKSTRAHAKKKNEKCTSDSNVASNKNPWKKTPSYEIRIISYVGVFWLMYITIQLPWTGLIPVLSHEHAMRTSKHFHMYIMWCAMRSDTALVLLL